MILGAKDYFLITLLNEQRNKEETEQNIGALNLNLKGESFVLICVGFQNKSKAFKDVYEQIYGIFSGLLNGETFISGNRIFLIVSDDEARISKNLNHLLTLIFEHLEK